jgi:hypothetical protein
VPFRTSGLAPASRERRAEKRALSGTTVDGRIDTRCTRIIVPFRTSGLKPRRANVAWKNAPSGTGRRWPRRFSKLERWRHQQ